ncbi:MAG: ribonuclease H-like domain-containing protein [Candidatus Lokiarchaeota archaeon]|nr:ribonuclease H-like domain-containing protein [Candidatus Lokiarchaeota archaeon]
MDYSYNFETFDITHIADQYKDKKIEDLFRNHDIVRNSMGQFMEIIWKEETFQCDLNLSLSKKKILRNLKTVYYIGETLERQLNRKGVKSLYDLRINLKYNLSAHRVLDLIENKEYRNLCRNKNIYDLDVAFCFDMEELLFLDIETLGLYDSPIIIVGLGYFKNNNFEIHILFARDLEEEIAMCEHLKTEILPNYSCFITYNGKSFDIPYIANRFMYFFDENPMISEEELPYERFNSKFHHIDLYHNCRRKYKGSFDSYTLTDMEEKLIDMKRENELPSSLVGLCYKKYLEAPLRYVGLVKEIIDHNYWDIYSMPLILQKLLED